MLVGNQCKDFYKHDCIIFLIKDLVFYQAIPTTISNGISNQRFAQGNFRFHHYMLNLLVFPRPTPYVRLSPHTAFHHYKTISNFLSLQTHLFSIGTNPFFKYLLSLSYSKNRNSTLLIYKLICIDQCPSLHCLLSQFHRYYDTAIIRVKQLIFFVYTYPRLLV